MRIIFVTGSLAHGGAERQSVAVMNRLAERGHQCHALYIKADGELLDRIRLRNGGSARSLGARRYLDNRALLQFASHILSIGPDVIVAANAYALMYATLALRLARARVPIVCTYHSTTLTSVKEQLQMVAYRPLFWLADCSVFVATLQRQRWARRAVLSRRNEVIYNGVDTETFRARYGPDERRWVRRALGFGDGDLVIAISAVMRPEKNHMQLLDAIATLRRAGIPARGLLIGDGVMRGEIRKRARALDIESSIVITGFKKDVRTYVEASDVVTLCSITEAMSMAIIEAMALGKPVVHSEVGGAAEMIDQGVNGFLFPVGDTRAYVEKLTLLADPELRATLGTNARRIVEERFSELAMVDRYERLLLDICNVQPIGDEALVQ